MESQEKERTAIAGELHDDHQIVRDGLRRIIEDAPDINVVAEASDGRDALRQAATAQPDVVIGEVLHQFTEDAKKGKGDEAFVTDEIVVERGNPVEQILKQAEEKNCDLIVMGTHGHGTLADVMLGSTARRVVRRSLKPVLVVRLPKEADE